MTKQAITLMIQGTTSDAGKSILVAGLCRVLARRGVRVAPFKPQNMALNSAVTINGGEIGRAQALQALACGIEPHTDFNPVLLKPCSDQGSQVIVNGKAISHLEAQQFGNIKALAFESVLAAFDRLKSQYEVILIEGAGSPAEINLRENDIANMGFAEAVNCPVILISDIDRGGVFAHIIGTLACLSEDEQKRIQGFVINKFRGNLELLQSGLDWLEEKTQKPVFGVVPFLKQLRLDAEDAISTAQPDEHHRFLITIKIPVFSRISNHTDFEPLVAHPNIDCQFIGPGDSLAGADLIILPGSKNVRSEMPLLRDYSWDTDIKTHCRYGGKLLGICGGFQLLGKEIADPSGVEDLPGVTETLGLLDITTELKPEKQLKRVTGFVDFGFGERPVNGYEIHCGVSTGADLTTSFGQLTEGSHKPILEGARSGDGQIIGTYLHGLFDTGSIVDALVEWVIGKNGSLMQPSTDWQSIQQQQLNRLADHLEDHLDLNALFSALR